MATKKKPAWPHGRTTKMSAHKNGQWVKKIRGKLNYFGPWDDPDGALQRYLANAEDLQAGRPVNTSPTSAGVTVAAVFNRYLAHRSEDVRQNRRELGEIVEDKISPGQFNRYRRAGNLMADVLGGDAVADDLTAADFARVHARLKANYKPETMANYANAIKTVLRWAHEEAELLTHRPKVGGSLTVKSLKRSLRQKRDEGRKRLLTPDQIHAMLAVGDARDRACIMLGINMGFGATDCGDLEERHIDRDAMLIDMPRLKTLVPRVCPLWVETLNAIDAAHAERPEPLNPADADKLLLSPGGRTLTGTNESRIDAKGRIRPAVHHDDVLQRFKVWCRKADIERKHGWGFRMFRTTFATIGKRSRDTEAVRVIMGHADAKTLEHYLEEEDHAALRAVTDHVHGWLWPAKKGGRKKKR